MPDHTEWHVALFGSGVGLRSVLPLTEEDHQMLTDARQRVVEIYSHHRFTLLAANQKQLAGMRDFARVLLVTRTGEGRDPSTRASLAVATALVNWTTSFRLYIDAAKTDLARRFGRKSSQFDAFNSRFDALLKSSDAVRLCWDLRNYIQHCRLPMPSLSSGLSEAGDAPWARVEFDRDALLADYGWPEARDVLADQPDHFDPVLVVDEAMRQLMDLERLLFEIDIMDAAAQAHALADVIAKVRSAEDRDGAVLHLLEARWSNQADQPNLVLAAIPEAMVFALVEVAEGRANADDLFRVAEVEDHPLQDDGFRDIFNEDNRGIRVLLDWMRDQGDPETYLRSANQIIDNDGEVDRLLGDALSLSYLLLGMTAHALGDTPEGLLTYLSGIEVRPSRDYSVGARNGHSGDQPSTTDDQP